MTNINKLNDLPRSRHRKWAGLGQLGMARPTGNKGRAGPDPDRAIDVPGPWVRPTRIGTFRPVNSGRVGPHFFLNKIKNAMVGF